MLRITHLTSGESATLKLEGQLLAAWVDEVIRACTADASAARPSRLDLSSVTFVDAAGINLLHDLRRRGFRIEACSPFVAALLK